MTLSMTRTAAHDDARPAAAMDEAAFRSLYERTARPLRAYLIRCLGDLTLADDLLQESYLRYLRAEFRGASDDHRRNYLFRIATNLVRDHFRRRRPETRGLPETGAVTEPTGDVGLRCDVGGAMSELQPRDRQMLWLAYVEGASHREIAAALGLRIGSVKSMLFRARGRLAAELRRRGLQPEEETP